MLGWGIIREDEMRKQTISISLFVAPAGVRCEFQNIRFVCGTLGVSLRGQNTAMQAVREYSRIIHKHSVNVYSLLLCPLTSYFLLFYFVLCTIYVRV